MLVLAGVTFYMKNTAAELESERKNRVVNEQKYREAREALRILYRDVQILTKSMNAQRQIVSRSSAEKSPLAGATIPPTHFCFIYYIYIPYSMLFRIRRYFRTKSTLFTPV